MSQQDLIRALQQHFPDFPSILPEIPNIYQFGNLMNEHLSYPEGSQSQADLDLGLNMDPGSLDVEAQMQAFLLQNGESSTAGTGAFDDNGDYQGVSGRTSPEDEQQTADEHRQGERNGDTASPAGEGNEERDGRRQEVEGVDPFKPKFTRTRTGCLPCRRAKHKCGEEKPDCKRCSKAQRECIWPDPTPAQPRAQPSNKRPRLIGPPRAHRAHSTTQSISSSAYDDAHRFELVGNDISSGNGVEEITIIRGAPPPVRIGRVPVDSFTSLFMDEKERDLMSHFLGFGSILMQVGANKENPVQYLELAQCLSQPRGSSIEMDAILLSLISIAAIHQSSLLMQRERKYIVGPVQTSWGETIQTAVNTLAPTSENQARMKAIGEHFSKTALELCRTGVLFKLDETASCDTVDMLLASAISIIISQALMGGTMWKDAFDLAVKVLDLRGGPASILKEAKAAGKSSNDYTKLLRSRRLLEALVVIDVNRCLATGSAPILMKEAFAPWFFDYTRDPYIPNDSDTVQKIFGLDRGLLELVNRINMLVHEAHVFANLPDRTYLEQNMQRGQDILLELDIWEGEVDAGTSLNRTQYGNIIMTHCLQVLVYVDILHLSHTDSAVQAAALKGIEHMAAAHAKGLCVTMLLPTIIMGSMMIEHSGRFKVVSVLENMRFQKSFSYDIESAIDILRKLYAMRDSGIIDPSWRLLTNSGAILF